MAMIAVGVPLGNNSMVGVRDPLARIYGLCNQNAKRMALLHSAHSGDICNAEPGTSCECPTGGIWIPWANNAEDLRNRRIIIRPFKYPPDTDFCIWHNTDEQKIYGSFNCQYDKKKELAQVPGGWNVVVSPTGDISLWDTSSQSCPP